MSQSTIEAARIAAGYSLADVARRINRTERHLRELERGTKKVPFYVAERLAALFDCSLDVFQQPYAARQRQKNAPRRGRKGTASLAACSNVVGCNPLAVTGADTTPTMAPEVSLQLVSQYSLTNTVAARGAGHCPSNPPLPSRRRRKPGTPILVLER